MHEELQSAGHGMGHAMGSVADHPWIARYPSGMDWAAPVPTGTLAEMFDRSAERFAHRPCIDFLGKRYTYGEIGRLVLRAAKGLQILGIGKGSRVGLLLPNTPYYVISYFAALKAGATVVNFNPLAPERELVRQLEDSETELVLTLDLKALFEKIAPQLGTHRFRRLVVCRMAEALPFPKNLLFPVAKRSQLATVTYADGCLPFDRLLEADGEPVPVEIDPAEDVAVLQYTGGTTGIPKGAMLTHANLTANAYQSVTWFTGAKEGEERVLGVLPFFHVFAMTVAMNLSVALGAELVVLPRFDIDQVMATIHKKRPTLVPAVPTIYGAIMNHKRLSRYDLTSIRYCISGGAPLPLDIKQSFEKLTGCTVFEGYGLTESGPVVCCNPLNPKLQKPGTIGIPYPETELEIVSLDDGETVLGPGKRGEVCIRGPQVMKGYWNRPEETAQVLRNGRLHTGDVGIMDEDGYFSIVDRIKDLILCGGFNVYPRTIEEAIYMHPAVEECVVAGVPDTYRGETVKAFIKLAEGQSLTKDELLAFLRDKLSPIELPKIVDFRTTPLPRTMIGKLSRKALLEEEGPKEAPRAA